MIQRHFACRLSTDHVIRGYCAVVLENELLRVTVLADKGADIVEFLHKPSDTDFLFRTPWGLHPAGKLVETSAHSLGAFHDHYEGGWQSIFPHSGPPSSENGSEQGLHGEVALMPWNVRVIADTSQEIAVEFSVRCYRTPFLLKKTLRLKTGVAALFIDEEAQNLGRETVAAKWGEHPALGSPFLSPDCRIDLPACEVLSFQEPGTPGLRMKAGAVGRWPKVPAPGGGKTDLSRMPALKSPCADMLFIQKLKAPWYAVRNEKTKVGFGLAWSPQHFPYLWYWQVFGGAKGYPWWSQGYHCALEPHSSMPGSREHLEFKAGQKRHARFTAMAFQGSSRIKRLGLDGRLRH